MSLREAVVRRPGWQSPPVRAPRPSPPASRLLVAALTGCSASTVGLLGWQAWTDLTAGQLALSDDDTPGQLGWYTRLSSFVVLSGTAQFLVPAVLALALAAWLLHREPHPARQLRRAVVGVCVALSVFALGMAGVQGYLLLTPAPEGTSIVYGDGSAAALGIPFVSSLTFACAALTVASQVLRPAVADLPATPEEARSPDQPGTAGQAADPGAVGTDLADPYAAFRRPSTGPASP